MTGLGDLIRVSGSSSFVAVTPGTNDDGSGIVREIGVSNGRKLRRLLDRGAGEGGARRVDEDAREGGANLLVEGNSGVGGSEDGEDVDIDGGVKASKFPVVENRTSI